MSARLPGDGKAIARVFASNSKRCANTTIKKAKALVKRGKAVLVEEYPYSVRLTLEHEFEKAARKLLEQGIGSNDTLRTCSLACRGAYRLLLEYILDNNLYYRIPDDAKFLATILNASIQEVIGVRKELVDRRVFASDSGYLKCLPILETQKETLNTATAPKGTREVRPDSCSVLLEKGAEIVLYECDGNSSEEAL